MRRPVARILQQGGTKTPRWGHILKCNYWCMQQTGGQTWNWCPDTTGPPLATTLECGQIHRCLFGYFHCECFCSWQCRISPNMPPKCLQGPMVISKKYCDITAHPEAKWPSQQNILIFCFFHFTIFSSICSHNFDRTVARKSIVPSRICLVKKDDAS